ncbi:baseplate J/gp47 family protein [Cellulosilyticum sp. ST5]|uniref:baseplate J/gp47 family protein n=1 Tax=Cellulosilyticum sp. ST5 TaxID=3055805 RepID=UPI0039774376
MSNTISYDELLNRTLERVSSSVDTSEGSFLFDAIAPCVAELYEAYLYIDELEKRVYADTSYGEYLERRCAERGIYRKQATHSIRRGYFDNTVPIGSRWGKEELVYIVTELMQDGVYLLKCEQSGVIGNRYDGNLINIDAVENINSAILAEVVQFGANEEQDDALRCRYFNSFEKEAFGGNIADYKEKVGSIDGVGQVKVYPAWDGGGTVKLRLLDTENNIPSSELIGKVQTKVDPVQNGGEGLGIAPIGHSVTVEAANEVEVQLTTHLTFKGSSWENVCSRVDEVVENYLSELRANWSDNDLVVRISQIESKILEIEGIIDIEDTQINGSTRNLYLSGEDVPVLVGVVNI